MHLSVGDIKINDRKKPSFLEVRIKASKTDVFRRGVTIYLGVTGVDICPVAAILSYMIHCQRWQEENSRHSSASAMVGH